MIGIHMTGAGWVFLSVAWTIILVSTVFCVVRVMGAKRPEALPDENDGEE